MVEERKSFCFALCGSTHIFFIDFSSHFAYTNKMNVYTFYVDRVVLYSSSVYGYCMCFVCNSIWHWCIMWPYIPYPIPLSFQFSRGSKVLGNVKIIQFRKQNLLFEHFDEWNQLRIYKDLLSATDEVNKFI